MQFGKTESKLSFSLTFNYICSMTTKKQNIKQNALNLAIFSGLGALSYYLLINSDTELISRVSEFDLTSPVPYFFVVVAFNILGFTIISMTRWSDSIKLPNILSKMKMPIIYLLAAAILLVINFMIIAVAKLSTPVIFPNGGYRFLIAVWLIQLVVMGLLLANRSAQVSMQLQMEAARLQKEKENDNAKYETLQNQLNPHFLFNSLNTLISEIEYNPASAVKFTRELSDVYRYVLQCQQQRTTSLKDELVFLESYIYLHQVRLGDCITFRNQISRPIDDAMLASLSLQIVAENIFKHNVINDNNKMVISVSISDDGKYLIVSNSLKPKITDTNMGIGLKNISSRYRLLNNMTVEYNIDTANEMFHVKIPLIYA